MSNAKISADDLRSDLRDATTRTWQFISRPGTWLSAAQRVDIVHEVRNATHCNLCARRADALSPAAVNGSHDRVGDLTDLQIDIVHRITCDQARLTETWLHGLLAAGVAEGEYVEIAGIVAMVMILDRFQWAIDQPADTPPTPTPGAISRYRPPGAKRSIAWVATVAPEDAVASDGDLYPFGIGNVIRALTQVPDTKRAYWDLANALYVPGDKILDVTADTRAISRPQIELLASTVSVQHNCFY